METVKIALNALKVNKLRSALTILGIVIGVAAVILLVSIGSGLSEFVKQQFDELGTDLLTIMPGKLKFGDAAGREGGPPGAANNKLEFSFAQDIQKEARLITATVPVAVTYSQTKYKKEERTTPILGTTENYETVRKSPVEKGEFFQKNAVSGSKKEAVLGKTALSELKITGDPTGEKIKISGQIFRIKGVLEEKGSVFGNDQDDLIIIPISTFQKTFDLDKVNYIYAKVSDTEKMAEAKQEVGQILLKKLKKEDFSIIDPKEFLKTVSSVLGALTAGLGGIAAISLIVGAIGIANIMLVSVTERTREIGLRKAVGGRPKDILFQFLVEAVVLSVVGGILGIVLGASFSFLLNRFIKTAVTLWSIILAFAVSVLVGIIAGVGPALRASQKNAIEALRYE